MIILLYLQLLQLQLRAMLTCASCLSSLRKRMALACLKVSCLLWTAVISCSSSSPFLSA